MENKNMTIDNRMRSIQKHNSSLQKNATSRMWDEMTESISLYLTGLHAKAFEKFYALFLSHSKEFRLSILKKDSYLYRMRIGDNGYEEFNSLEEMFHIPFHLNHLVGNERYSISGFPSLYLGSSVYVCWEEMRRPNMDYANIALFKPTKDITVLDISTPEHLHFSSNRFTDCLVLACSMPVSEPAAPFKPEYIIPQLLLQSIVMYNREKTGVKIDGIKYSSTHIKDKNLWVHYPENRKNRELFYNYVFPAYDRTETGISLHLSELFQFHNSITYNKMKMMYPDFKTEGNDNYTRTLFGKIENRLQTLPLHGMLTYDSTNPVGALTS